MSESLYYNLFDPTKNYYEVRALAGLIEQSREDNEMQSILRYLVKKLGDTLYKDGSLVSGGEFNTNPSNPRQLAMGAAKIWFNGIIHDVPASTVTLSGVGDESVGVQVVQTVVTYAEDGTLVDPSTISNYGQPGANRLQITASWQVNSNLGSFIPFYTFKNGVQQTQPKIGEIDPVAITLARRDYDLSGNYVVAGFDMAVSDLNNTQYNLTVGNLVSDPTYAGSKAYVRGTEIGKLINESMPLPKALISRSVSNEQKVYSNADYQHVAQAENRFPLANQPVAQINQVFATFGVTRSITNHHFNSFDSIAQAGESLIDVKAVWKTGSVSAPDYVKSTNGAAGPGDYYISGNGIRWDVTGSSNEPTDGDTYQYYALVNRALSTTEYTTYTDPAGVVYLDITPVNPVGSSTVLYSHNPNNNATDSSVINVFYDFYLSRVDTVYLSVDALNPNGVLAIQNGTPDITPIAPQAPGQALALGQILVKAGTGTAAQNVAITPYNVKRLTQLEINNFVNRIKQTEYNAAVKDLDSQGLKRAGNSAATLSGIFTESFTYSAKDIVWDGRVNPDANPSGASLLKFVRTGASTPAYTTRNMINIRDRELNLPETSVGYDLTPGASGSTSTAFNMGHTLETKASFVAAAHANATTGIGVTASNTTRKPQIIAQSEITRSLMDNTSIEAVDPYNALPVVKTSLGDKAVLSTNPELLRNFSGFSDGLTVFMDQTWVWVFAENFTAGTYIDVKFDGKPVRMTVDTTVAGAYSLGTLGGPPSMSTFTGSASGNIYPSTSYVIASASGQVAFAFEVPQGVATNAAALTLQSAAGEIAATEFVMDPKVSFQDHAVSTSSSKTLKAVSDPVLPKLTSVTAKNSGGTPITNMTSNTSVHFDVQWDKAGGIPLGIILIVDPPAMADASVRVQTITRDQFNNTNLTTQTWTTGSIAATGAFRYTAYIYNEKGLAAPVVGYVTLNGAMPSKSDPSAATASAITPVASSLVGSAPASWSGLTDVSALKIFQSAPGVAPVAVADPNTTTTATVSTVPGVNTLVFLFTSSTGSFVQAFTFSAPVPAGKTGGDEVAQTFSVGEASFITDVDVYMSQVPTLTSGQFAALTLEIRDTADGSPIAQLVDNARSTKTLTSTGNEIVASNNAATATKFVFAAPVFLEPGKQYAIVLRSDNKDFKVYRAKPGENLVGTSTALQASAGYQNGALMTSASNSTWVTTDNDLKFNVNATTFKNQSVIYFNTLTSLNNASGMRLGISSREFILPTAGTATQATTSVIWEYSINNSGTWLPFQPEAYIDFAVAATILKIRASFTSLNEKLSPRLPKLGTSVVVLNRSLTGTYMSKAVNLVNAYRYVRMIVKEVTPGSTSTAWFVSDDTAAPGSTPSAWSSSTTYASGSFVTSGGKTYQSLQSGNLNHTPSSSTAWWLEVTFYGNLVWTPVPSVGQITSSVDGTFIEHDRTIDLGTNAGRKTLRVRVDLTANNIAATLTPPRVRDIIAIVNS